MPEVSPVASVNEQKKLAVAYAREAPPVWHSVDVVDGDVAAYPLYDSSNQESMTYEKS